MSRRCRGIGPRGGGGAAQGAGGGATFDGSDTALPSPRTAPRGRRNWPYTSGVTEPENPAEAPLTRSEQFRLRLDRSVVASGVMTSILLGVASVLTAFAAFQASEYSDYAGELDLLANRIAVDNINQAQQNWTEHAVDTGIWLQIAARGETIEESPLGGLLSQRWIDAVERVDSAGEDVGADGRLALPLDDRYFEELGVEANAYLDALERAYNDARQADDTATRITTASILYSVALLLLTVASTTSHAVGRLGLHTSAVAVIVVAFIVGLAPLRL